MQFLNLTPFGAAAFRGVDPKQQEHDVVVLRTVYRLVPAWQLAGVHPPVNVPTKLVALIRDEDAPGLITEDQFFGVPGQSSERAESDLAPFKPQCDVIVSGHAHAPCGRPAHEWLARLRVSQPTRHPDADSRPPDLEPLESDAAFARRLAWQEEARLLHDAWLRAPGPDGDRKREVLLDKTLRVHAPRRFVRSLLGGWRIQREAPVATVALRYELAYGGLCRVPNPRHGKQPDAPEFLLNEVCYVNPLGCGWIHEDFRRTLDAAKQPMPKTLLAPQFEPHDQPVKDLDFCPQSPGLTVAQMLQQSARYAHQPAGFGAVGRAWTPRIQHAGTYDDAWLHHRWPQLPENFNVAYWNAAPPDQQTPYPRSDCYIELGGLVDPALCPTGHAYVALPGHRASVLFRLASGLMLGGPCVIDTIHIDTDEMELALTWRASVTCAMQAVQAELRFQVDADKPLFTADADSPSLDLTEFGSTTNG